MPVSGNASGLIVIHPGLAATIQDLGRPGYRGLGVPPAGAFDRASFGLANALVGNGPGDAAVELTMVGGRYRATARLGLALAGAPFEARLVRADGVEVAIAIPRSFAMGPGDTLLIGGTGRGLRGYLAVRGGWRTPMVLGSRSSEARIEPGAIVPARDGWVADRRPADPAWPDPADGPIRLVDGPDGAIPVGLLDAAYRVSPVSDRVGLRLDGPSLDGLEQPGRVSAPVAAGAVQVAGGRPLILGVAGGTMGGYPHVGHVVSADLDRIAQARPGDRIRFARVDLDEARRLDRDRRERLAARAIRIGLGAAD